ncbi:MAG: TetR/AcrR family transcriptional regulator [Actinobacteria bacterium]|nr:TetR/AcrR family transcriptional regulator [Actinomycetota bacterium]
MRTLPEGMREKVLAAAELIADHGLDATKMEDIAATTGVPKATLYYYFEGKEDILAFLFTEILDEVGRAVDNAMRTNGTAADRLRAVVVAQLRVVEAYPAASRALQFDLGRAARTPLIDEQVESAYRRPLRRLLEEGVDDGSLRPVEHPGLVATAVLGAVATAGINAIAAGPRRSADEVAGDIVALVIDGVGA